MQIILNGERCAVPDHCTISDLIEAHPPAHQAYAVEVNRHVVPRREHVDHRLNEGDRIEIVTLVGGG